MPYSGRELLARLVQCEAGHQDMPGTRREGQLDGAVEAVADLALRERDV